MTSKEIVDGADATIIAELDDAAEARIIDVLSRVFVTNKYPELRAAIITGIERHQTAQRNLEQQRQKEEEMKRMKSYEQYKYETHNKMLQDVQNAQNRLSQQSIANTPLDKLTGFGKKFW